MGVVFRATQLALQRLVALKAIAPELAADEGFRDRFQRESHIAASIDHPNVIPVYEAGELDGTLYLIMRWVDGTDLRTLLKASGRLRPGRAIELLRPVASALAAAHRRGLVHRDIKPANVLVARGEEEGEDRVYLSDFGIARRTDRESGVTRTGMFVGTVDYTAPERFQGGRGTPASDIYSFGCVLFEALTGHVPFVRPTGVSVIYAHVADPIPSARDEVPDVPEELDAIIAKAMAKRPEDRFGSAGELTAALGQALQALDTAERRATTTGPPALAPDPPAPTVVTDDGEQHGEPTEAGDEPGPTRIVPAAGAGAVAAATAGAGAAAAADPPSTPTRPPPTPTDSPPTRTDPPPTRTDPPPTRTDPPPTRTDPPPTRTDPPPTRTDPPPTRTEPPPTRTEPPRAPTEPPPTRTEPTTPARGPRRRRSPWLWAAPLIVVSLAVVLIATFSDVHNQGGTNSASKPAASAVTVQGGGMTAGRTFTVASVPGSVSIGRKNVWVSLPDSGKLVRTDLKSGKQSIFPASGRPTALSAGFRALWVAQAASRSLAQFNGDSGGQVAAVKLPGRPLAVALDLADGTAWVADSSGAISHVDVGATVIGTPAHSDPAASSLDWGEGGVWATNGAANGLLRVSLDTSGSSTPYSAGRRPIAVALDQGVWVGNANGHLTRFDPQPGHLRVNADVSVAPDLEAIAATDPGPYVWAASKSRKAVYRVTNASNPAVTGRIAFSSPPVALAVNANSVWVATQDRKVTEIRF
jgi:serine/threonine protein kinase